ncbi:MAG: proline racemase, partial [Candidatus Korarchaeota archaeon]|nr:proline racemase [Candidatus Korarchaeota archaeon]NIU82626.1 proline racemase [Candidatus Thorarchaeota archaeon]NIW13108.1 proline racemase [Candidatus Thorarchaeota archaeon]
HRDADLGVFFMDNKGYLDMCGHGTMGVVTAFIENGGLPFKSSIKIETPAGFVKARPKIVRDQVKHVTVQNVDSFVVDKVEINFDAEHKKISIPVDVVYSGNLFGLVNVQNFEFDVPVTPNNVGKFINYGLQIREKINEKRFTNPFTKRTEKVGLIEFYQPNENKPDKNVVIFGDGAVDRSPCGTGTCAKMTLLFNKGELEVGDTYTYESIIGTSFKGRIVDAKKKKGLTIITPEVTGSAYIVARHSFVHQPEDPLTGFQLPHHIQ